MPVFEYTALDRTGREERGAVDADSAADARRKLREARVHVLTAPFLTIPGPRVGMAAECLADLIHPDAARQEDTTRSAEP